VIWDFLNAIIGFVVGSIRSAYALLPQSPLYIDSTTVTAAQSVAGYGAWFFPVAPALAILVLYVVGIGIWVAFLAVKQFVYAITP
jgi:ABC-type polysaccharide/polyol phosphate export permease